MSEREEVRNILQFRLTAMGATREPGLRLVRRLRDLGCEKAAAELNLVVESESAAALHLTACLEALRRG